MALINESDKTLDIKAFLKLVPKIKWTKVIRKLGNKKETWYSGYLETKERKIKVSIRPTKRMQVQEIFKKRLFDGSVPEKDKNYQEGKLVDFGCSCQILVEDPFIEKVDKISKPIEKKKKQVISGS